MKASHNFLIGVNINEPLLTRTLSYTSALILLLVVAFVVVAVTSLLLVLLSLSVSLPNHHYHPYVCGIQLLLIR